MVLAITSNLPKSGQTYIAQRIALVMRQLGLEEHKVINFSDGLVDEYCQEMNISKTELEVHKEEHRPHLSSKAKEWRKMAPCRFFETLPDLDNCIYAGVKLVSDAEPVVRKMVGSNLTNLGFNALIDLDVREEVRNRRLETRGLAIPDPNDPIERQMARERLEFYSRFVFAGIPIYFLKNNTEFMAGACRTTGLIRLILEDILGETPRNPTALFELLIPPDRILSRVA